MQEGCLVQLEIKEPLWLLTGLWDLSTEVTLSVTLDDVLVYFCSHIAKYKPFFLWEYSKSIDWIYCAALGNETETALS